MKIRAMVFDDEKLIRLMLLEVLKNRGYDVLTFSEPGMCTLYQKPECGCENNQSCADIIISDIKMPNASGLEFVDKLLKGGCKIKNIALMSGYWSDTDIQRAKELGCKTFEKPFPIKKMEEWLDECEKKIDPNRVLSDWFQQQSLYH